MSSGRKELRIAIKILPEVSSLKCVGHWISVFLLVLLSAGLAVSQSKDTAKPDPAQAQDKSGSSSADPQADPLKRPLSPEQKKQQEKKFKQELEGPYKKWLSQDVAWIITDEERAAFKQLSNNEERDQFIEQFWLRRDPTPDTEENEIGRAHV